MLARNFLFTQIIFVTSIILGDNHIETNLGGYNTLIGFYERCRTLQSGEKQILIDFEKLRSIDANMSAVLMAIINKLNKEHQLIFFVDTSILRSRFPALIRNGWFAQAGIQLIPSSTASEIRLTGFNKGDDVKFLEFIEKDLLSHAALQISEKDKLELTNAFLELFTNIENHAGVDMPIFACGQYLPEPARLCFTLVDTGVGYLAPIQEFTHGAVSTAQEAILWALEGNSTKTDAPGGLGLKLIQKFCEKSGSKFEIITGGEYWSNFQLFPVRARYFCGTIVNIIFDCQKR